MRTLAVVSRKGGVGKTTLSGHLAVEAINAGAGVVALIDTDPQGSLAAWWSEREAEEPLYAHATVEALPRHLAELEAHGVDLVIIDTPPAITSNIEAVLKVAHLVLIPTRPSPHDLRAVGATVDLCEQAAKPIVFILNGATMRTRISGEAAIALSQHGTVAPTTIHQRVDFAASMTDGRTVGEIAETSRSAQEITDLWRYVNARLSKYAKGVDHAQAKTA